MVNSVLASAPLAVAASAVASLVLVAALVPVVLLGRRRPASRHLVAMVGLTGALVLPAALVAAPARVAAPAWMLEQLRGSIPGASALTAPAAALALAALGLWLVGVAVLARRVWDAHASAARLLARARPAGPHLEAVAAAGRAELGLDAGVAVMESAEVTTAVAVYARRPVVVVPADLPASEHRAAVMVGLAQVRRGDWASSTLAQAALSVWWFNPVAHWLELEARRDARLAAEALAAGPRPMPAWRDELERLGALVQAAARPGALARVAVVALLSLACLTAGVLTSGGAGEVSGARVAVLSRHLHSLERAVAETVEPAAGLLPRVRPALPPAYRGCELKRGCGDC